MQPLVIDVAAAGPAQALMASWTRQHERTPSAQRCSRQLGNALCAVLRAMCCVRRQRLTPCVFYESGCFCQGVCEAAKESHLRSSWVRTLCAASQPFVQRRCPKCLLPERMLRSEMASSKGVALEVVGGARGAAAHPLVQVLHRQADDAVLRIACAQPHPGSPLVMGQQLTPGLRL